LGIESDEISYPRDAYGTQNILDRIYCPRARSGLSAPIMVGPGRNRPHRIHQLVDRIPQRLVLRINTARVGLRAWSSTDDAPRAIDRDSGAHNLQLLS
jgi:hypothetical protein